MVDKNTFGGFQLELPGSLSSSWRIYILVTCIQLSLRTCQESIKPTCPLSPTCSKNNLSCHGTLGPPLPTPWLSQPPGRKGQSSQGTRMPAMQELSSSVSRSQLVRPLRTCSPPRQAQVMHHARKWGNWLSGSLPTKTPRSTSELACCGLLWSTGERKTRRRHQTNPLPFLPS